MISWDEPKRRENLRKHKIDLADLESVFDYPMVSGSQWKMIAKATESSDCKVWLCGKVGLSSWYGPREATTPRI